MTPSTHDVTPTDTAGVRAGPGQPVQGAVALPLGDEVLAAIRETVRDLLLSNPEYVKAAPEFRRNLAHSLVTVSAQGAKLLAEEQRLAAAIARRAPQRPPVGRQRLVAAQSAGDQLGLQAARNAGSTIEALKKAIDFPHFVQSLISGVFEAITRSNMHQLEAIGELLDSVSTATEDFTESNVSDANAVAWALQKFPFLTSDSTGLALREGVDLAEQGGALRAALGKDADDVDASDLAGSLLPLVKRKVGQSRQQMLATMVQMGLQRIVVDQGQLHASMDMRVDTSSISTENRGEQSHLDVSTGASGSFGMGAWGASAYVNTSFGKVESDQQYTQEQLASRAGLRSSVDLAFRTEQIPLDRMADEKARVKLNLAARVPLDVDSGASLLQTPPVAPSAPATTPALPAPAAPPTASPRPAAASPAAPAAAPPARPPAATGNAAQGGSGNAAQGGSGNAAQGGSGNAAQGGSGNAAQGGSGNAAQGGSGNAAQGGSGNAAQGGSGNAAQGGSGNAAQGAPAAPPAASGTAGASGGAAAPAGGNGAAVGSSVGSAVGAAVGGAIGR